jgi:hypothetical protein
MESFRLNCEDSYFDLGNTTAAQIAQIEAEDP